MKLDELSIDDLVEFSGILSRLIKSALLFDQGACQPTFNLTPGREITIRTGMTMPMPPILSGCSGEPVQTVGAPITVYEHFTKLAATLAEAKPSAVDATSDEGLPPPGPLGGALVPDQAEDTITASLTGVDEVPAEAVPEAYGIACEADAPAPAETIAGGGVGVPPPGGEFKTGSLSESEKCFIRQSASRGNSSAQIARSLNRKVQTVALFMSAFKKSDTFTATSAEVIADPASGATPASKAASPAMDPAMDPVRLAAIQRDACRYYPLGATRPRTRHDGGTITATPRAGDGMAAHLANLPRKNGWTLELDAELMRLICVGRRFPEIEADLGKDKVKERFDLLTDSRSYPREKVSAQLQYMLAAKG